MQAETLISSAKHFGEAYAPGHITGFFTVHLSQDPIYTGSTGAGICLEAGVNTRVTIRESARSELVLLWNDLPLSDTKIPMSVISKFVDKKSRLSVTAEQRSLLPVNYGYGISGASALSFALALNKALGSPFPTEKVGEIAHVVEVENLTGLGDVSAQMVGGFEVRVKAGAPTIGRVQKLPDPKEYVVITTPVKPILTSKMISDLSTIVKINEQGKIALSAFMENPKIEPFIKLSRGFWESLWSIDAEIMRTIKKYESFRIPFVSLKKGLVYGLVHEDGLSITLRRISDTAPTENQAPLLIYERSSGLPFIISRLSTRGAH